MTSLQAVRLVTGVFIIFSIAFGAPASPFFISQWWLFFTLLVAVNVLQSGLSDCCLIDTALRKVGCKFDS